MRIESWSRSETGYVRESNQDAIGCYPERGLFVVADGMGGHADGERASRLAVEILAASLSPDSVGSAGQPLEQKQHALASAVRQVNHSIFSLGRASGAPAHRAMGTTLVALQIDASSGSAAWTHVGDSRLYRLRGAKLELLTADHTRFGEPFRDGGPVPLDLPHTNQLTAALGIDRTIEVPAAGEVDGSGSTYLLCSDGLSGLVPAERIRDHLGDRTGVAAAAGALLEAALSAGGTDNVSLIVVRLEAR
jgi:protein phosphatase